MLITSVATGCAPVETTPHPGITVEVSFPDGAPPLDQEAELNCVITSQRLTLENMSVEIRLPEGLELVSGELFWLGDVAKGDEIVAIEAIVRAVKIGNWAIELSKSIDPEEQGGFGFMPGWLDAIYVSVSEDSAEWGIYPPWYKNGSHAVPITVVDAPVVIDFSISHPPLLNEPAELTLTLSPRDDMPSITARIILPEGAALVSGNLEWQRDLKAGVPATLSAQIVFNETGNCRIDGGYWQWVGEENSWGVYRSIYLIIGIDQSDFAQPPEPDVEDLPPPPSTSLND